MKPLYRWAFLTLFAFVVIQGAALYLRSRSQWRDRLTAANALADASHTEHFLRGQLRVATRYIHQGQVELEKALRDRPAKPKLAVDFASEARRDSGADTPALTVSAQVVTFDSRFGDLDSLGYLVENHARIQGVGPIMGQQQVVFMRYDVTQAPLHLGVRVACEGPDARVWITGPRWRQFDIARGVMDPNVCNPPPTWHPFEITMPSVPIAGGLVAVGWLLHDLFGH